MAAYILNIFDANTEQPISATVFFLDTSGYPIPDTGSASGGNISLQTNQSGTITFTNASPKLHLLVTASGYNNMEVWAVPGTSKILLNKEKQLPELEVTATKAKSWFEEKKKPLLILAAIIAIFFALKYNLLG